VAEQGSNDELIAQGGIYAELVRIQQRVVNEQSAGAS
jgi:subfamily B ATP-binding cassette protein MsbA